MSWRSILPKPMGRKLCNPDKVMAKLKTSPQRRKKSLRLVRKKERKMKIMATRMRDIVLTQSSLKGGRRASS